ncbi:efflux RND transporter periplasmic adaptor subunit [Janthinobacterium agaricidamnosum]|uniref:Efflux transporter, RND family, MFP subunit n=1 Tax=Janthinobacterium agaricidamnosum NBRC 102515 = DSM 9628 TaxID=1349767 RepID=W0V2N3_9BURK|nr:efflux RND transporter periplasmic adaptor subunit [Janthinobacterium agaricidamnosum]CDG81517.1 efflux transporter, RND family, MFP subunit [Janthinobacterium agaricidamnosum NBRC 102515 = DSM 9628]
MKLETLPPSSIQSAPRGKRWRAPVIGLIVLGLAGAGWSVMQARQKPAATLAQPSQQEKKAVIHELARSDVAAIGARSLTVNLPLSGSLTPLTQATIKSKVSGEVHETTLQEGMQVSAGQVLARLDTADLKARLMQQQAALDEAQARLSLANKNEVNNLALLKQKYISQTAYDTTQNNVELARANVKSAAATLEIARIALADTVIRAPIAGIVSKRHVQAGEKLAPDMPVYTIVNLARMTLEAQVPASEIPRIKVGQQVTFKVDGFQERDFAGAVVRINPTTESGSRAMLVYISVDNRDGALRGGMFAKGNITTERSAVMPLVPLAALRNEQGRQVVYKIEHDKVVSQPVRLGLRNDDEGYAEVTEGLEQGASVIVARLDGVKPGHRVKLPAPPASTAETRPALKG